MASKHTLDYSQLMDGYESVESFQDDITLIDDYLVSNKRPIIPKPIQEHNSRGRGAQSNQPRPHPLNSKSQNHDKSAVGQYSFAGKKAYRFLNQFQLSKLQLDLKNAQLSKQELIDKYGISNSSITRFIRDYKMNGRITPRARSKAKSEKASVVYHIMAANPYLSFRQIREKVLATAGNEVQLCDLKKIFLEIRSKCFN